MTAIQYFFNKLIKRIMNLWIGINWVKKNYGNQAERSCQRSGSRPSTFLLWKDYNFRLQMIFAYLENIYCSCDAVPVTARGPSNRCLKKAAVNFILSNCSLPSFFLRTEPTRTLWKLGSSLPLNYTFIFLSIITVFSFSWVLRNITLHDI